jgi:hypothetical protein
LLHGLQQEVTASASAPGYYLVTNAASSTSVEYGWNNTISSKLELVVTGSGTPSVSIGIQFECWVTDNWASTNTQTSQAVDGYFANASVNPTTGIVTSSASGYGSNATHGATFPSTAIQAVASRVGPSMRFIAGGGTDAHGAYNIRHDYWVRINGPNTSISVAQASDAGDVTVTVNFRAEVLWQVTKQYADSYFEQTAPIVTNFRDITRTFEIVRMLR